MLALNVIQIAFFTGIVTAGTFYAVGYVIALGKQIFDEMMR